MPSPDYAMFRGANAGLTSAGPWAGAGASSAAPPDPRYRLVSKGVGVVALLLAPLWFSSLLFAGDYEYTSAIALVPLLMVLNLGLVVAASRRDPFLRLTMLAATVLKVAGAGAALFMSYRVYETGSDALHYFSVGQELANAFWARGEWPLMQPLWSTNLIHTLTAYLVMILGPSMPALFVLFSFFSLWGLYFFYRAFCLAFPEGNRAAVALLLFFLPSLVFWTACIGKDAVIAFFLGLVAYGFARVRLRPGVRPYLVLGIGLLGVMAVRPHVAAMLGASLVAPNLLAPSRRGIGGGLSKVAGLLILAAGTAFMVSQAQDFLQVDDFQKAPAMIEKITNTTRLGGSAFGSNSSLPVRVAMAPFLLFRPLPWEAHNPQSAIAALEGMALLYLFWRSRKQLRRLVQRWRANAYVLFIVLFAVEFCITFSAAASNFGTLSRMRAMLLPFALLLLCAPPVVARAGARYRSLLRPQGGGRVVTEAR